MFCTCCAPYFFKRVCSSRSSDCCGRRTCPSSTDEPASHISRKSTKMTTHTPCVKASQFILNAFRVCTEVTVLGSRFQRGTTLFVKKWCLLVVALQFWLLSFSLKLSIEIVSLRDCSSQGRGKTVCSEVGSTLWDEMVVNLF